MPLGQGHARAPCVKVCLFIHMDAVLGEDLQSLFKLAMVNSLAAQCHAREVENLKPPMVWNQRPPFNAS